MRSDLAASDFCQLLKTDAEIFGYEVARKTVLHGFDDADEGVVGGCQSSVVAGRGDDDVVLCYFRNFGCVIHTLLQLRDASSVLCADCLLGKGLAVGENYGACCGAEVYFILYDDYFLSAAYCFISFVSCCRRLFIEKPEDDGGLV